MKNISSKLNNHNQSQSPFSSAVMFHISPSKKETSSKTPPPVVVIESNPVIKWTTERNFIFPPALTMEDTGVEYPRFKPIREAPKIGYSSYNLISQYNPWLDCEMTREKRVYLTPRVGEFSCAVSYSNNSNALDNHLFRNESIIDIVNLYLWPLLYSRADDVIACRTFADWRHLFKVTISLAFPDYEYWVSVAAAASGGMVSSSTYIPISDKRRTLHIMKYMSAERILYLLTTRANFWPYGPPVARSSLQQYGICLIKPKIKDYNDKTKIDWLVGADFLRKMKRVHMYFISATIHATSIINSNIYDDDE